MLMLRRLFPRLPRRAAPVSPRSIRVPCGRRARPRLEPLEDRSLPSTYHVTSLLDTGSGSGLSGDLRYAITQANANPGPDAIVFDVTGTITLSSALPALADEVDIQGPGADQLTISGNHLYRVFDVDAGVTARIAGLTISEGMVKTPDPGLFFAVGGGIYNAGTLTVRDCILSDNSGTRYGGGIYNETSATLMVSGSALSDNSADDGGGIANYGTVTVSTSTLSGNAAAFYGGGVYNASALTIDDSTLSGNTARANGGGAINNLGTLTVSHSTLSNNSTTGGSGGGIYNASSGRATVSYGIVSGNSASYTFGADGGGIFNTGTMTVSNSTLSGNFANSGGGISNVNILTVTNSILSGNSAFDGGGISSNFGPLTVSNSTLSGNTASAGGGISNAGPLTVSNSTLSGNSALGGTGGGGIYNTGSLTISNSTLSGNSAFSGGGILTLTITHTVTLANVTITGNRGGLTVGYFGYFGGGLYYGFGGFGGLFPLLHNTLIAGNFSGPSGTVHDDDVYASLTAASDNNLIGDGTNLFGVRDGVNGNQVGTAASPIDPLLAPLGDYGGPTPTHALLPGSPALDAGNPADAPATDQRGVPRTGTANIGAFQATATQFVFGGLPDSTAAGTPLPFTLTAEDPFGQPAVGYTGTVTFASSDGSAAPPADYTFTPADAGSHTFADGVTFFRAGDQALTASDLGDAGLSGSGAVTVRAAAVASFDLSVAGPVTAGQPFELTVTARDAYGNVVTDYQGRLALASVFGGDDLRLGYAFTADDAGSHTFTVTLLAPGAAGIVAADSDALAFGFTTLDVLPAG